MYNINRKQRSINLETGLNLSCSRFWCSVRWPSAWPSSRTTSTSRATGSSGSTEWQRATTAARCSRSLTWPTRSTSFSCSRLVLEVWASIYRLIYGIWKPDMSGFWSGDNSAVVEWHLKSRNGSHFVQICPKPFESWKLVWFFEC